MKHENSVYNKHGMYSQTSKGAVYGLFSALRDRKRLSNIRDTPLCLNFFETRNFKKHQKFPLQNYEIISSLWDKFFFQTSLRDTPI